MGAITDILAAEAVAQCEGASNPAAVRDRAKASLIRFGPASEALGDLEQWWILRPLLRANRRRARTVAAIAPVEFGHGSTKISDLIAGRFRTPDEAGFALAVMERALGKEIATRGDRRIEDPGRIAGDFFREVAELQPSGETDVWEFIVRTSEARGVRREEIRMDMTGDELGALSPRRPATGSKPCGKRSEWRTAPTGCFRMRSLVIGRVSFAVPRAM